MIGQQLVFIQGFSRDGVKGPHLQRSFNSGAFVAGQTKGAAAAAAAVRMTRAAWQQATWTAPYLWPLGVITGSFMISKEIPQHKCSGGSLVG